MTKKHEKKTKTETIKKKKVLIPEIVEEEPEEKENKGDSKEITLKSGLPATTTSLQRYIAEISNYPVLSREEEYELAKKYREEGDLEAARKLITANLRFVVRIANEYKNYGINIMDLIQEGNIGLMQAVKGFDPTRGYRLISYAVWWIRAYIQNHIIKSWSLVKVGTSQAQRKLFYKLRSTKQQMELAGETPTEEEYEEIAEALNVPTKDVMEMDVRMSRKDLSLDTELTDDSDHTHLDYVEDTSPSQEEELAKTEETILIRENLEEIMKTLNERERYIIEHRILTEQPETLEQIGERFNISRERVRQIEKAALKKIKKKLKELGVK